MNIGVINGLMLLGLLAAAIPLILHLLSRRRDPVVVWAAMQFLESGQSRASRFALDERLLLLLRTLLILLIVLALSRPFWDPPQGAASTDDSGEINERVTTGPFRDVVVVIDGSTSMARRQAGGQTGFDRAWDSAADLVAQLRPRDGVGLILAGDRIEVLTNSESTVDPRTALQRLDLDPALRPEPLGGSDLPSALIRALEMLRVSRRVRGEIVVLGDGQSFAWRPGASGRWDLVRDLHGRLDEPPAIWAVDVNAQPGPDPNTLDTSGDLEIAERSASGPDAAILDLDTPLGRVLVGRSTIVRATIANVGPGPLPTRTATLRLDGREIPGASRRLDGVAEGDRIGLRFPIALESPGSHLIELVLDASDDPLVANDRAWLTLEAIAELPVLLVDGDRHPEPLRSETDLVARALAPTNLRGSPIVLRRITPNEVTTSDLDGRFPVVIVADVPDLLTEWSDAVLRFLDGGGGLLIAPGDRVDPESMAPSGSAWLPARPTSWRGDPATRRPIARPEPQSFQAVLGRLTDSDDREGSPLADASLFAYWQLDPATGSDVLARLDGGDPWIVTRRVGRGHALMIAGPLSADSGTLPVNLDFVPLINDLVLWLADPEFGARSVIAGSPLTIAYPGLQPDASTLPVIGPEGRPRNAQVVRDTDGRFVVRLDPDQAVRPGPYRFSLQDRSVEPSRSVPDEADSSSDPSDRVGESEPGSIYRVVRTDPAEADPERLSAAESARLARGWPLAFVDDQNALLDRVLGPARPPRQEIWRGLIVVALVLICLEIALTRRLARARGID